METSGILAITTLITVTFLSILLNLFNAKTKFILKLSVILPLMAFGTAHAIFFTMNSSESRLLGIVMVLTFIGDAVLTIMSFFSYALVNDILKRLKSEDDKYDNISVIETDDGQIMIYNSETKIYSTL